MQASIARTLGLLCGGRNTRTHFAGVSSDLPISPTRLLWRDFHLPVFHGEFRVVA